MKHLSTKIREVTSNVVTTKKNEALCQAMPGTQGTFSDKVAPDIEDFTDETECQCDVEVVKVTFHMISNK